MQRIGNLLYLYAVVTPLKANNLCLSCCINLNLQIFQFLFDLKFGKIMSLSNLLQRFLIKMNNCNNNTTNIFPGKSLCHHPAAEMSYIPSNLPLPPFMPPSVKGSMGNCWSFLPAPPPPETFPHTPTYHAPSRNNCTQFESFPYTSTYQKQKNANRHFYFQKNLTKEEKFIDFCDVCDRGFKTEEKRQQHYSEHTRVSKSKVRDVVVCVAPVCLLCICLLTCNVCGRNAQCWPLHSSIEFVS